MARGNLAFNAVDAILNMWPFIIVKFPRNWKRVDSSRVMLIVYAWEVIKGDIFQYPTGFTKHRIGQAMPLAIGRVYGMMAGAYYPLSFMGKSGWFPEIPEFRWVGTYTLNHTNGYTCYIHATHTSHRSLKDGWTPSKWTNMSVAWGGTSPYSTGKTVSSKGPHFQ